MEKFNNCIVVNKGEFEISTYRIYTDKRGFINRELPKNLVLIEPEKTWSNNDYSIVNNGVSLTWLDYYNDSRWKFLTVTYKGTKLLEINAVRKIQIVLDALNRFKNISHEELDKVYQRALKEEKSELEKEVEKLKEEKKIFLEYHKNINEVESKMDELKELLNKINE